MRKKKKKEKNLLTLLTIICLSICLGIEQDMVTTVVVSNIVDVALLENAMHNNSHYYRRRGQHTRNELLIISVTSM